MRTEGFYWIRVEDFYPQWVVAQWIGDAWITCGDNGYLKEATVDEVGRRVCIEDGDEVERYRIVKRLLKEDG